MSKSLNTTGAPLPHEKLIKRTKDDDTLLQEFYQYKPEIRNTLTKATNHNTTKLALGGFCITKTTATDLTMQLQLVIEEGQQLPIFIANTNFICKMSTIACTHTRMPGTYYQRWYRHRHCHMANPWQRLLSKFKWY